MSNIKRRVKWNKHGVSEIIGNILILGITVTLFSSIMWFVTAMPTPQEHAYADMTSDLNVGYSSSSGGWASISVSHKGGQELKSDATGIYIYVNDTTLLKYKITDSNPSVGTSWTAGEVWHFNITSATFPVGKDPSKARISLLITDTVKNSEVYSVILSGGESGINPSPPIIGARGTTPSPTYAGDGFYYYATVTDPNNDLNKNSIYLDASSINPSWMSLKMTDSNNDGVFTAASPMVANLGWNGGIVIVNATDTSGHSVIGRITLSILYKGGGNTYPSYGPFNNYSSYLVNGTYPPDATGGESGGQTGTSGTTFYYIREYANPTVITRDFDGGERVLIEVWSDSLRNLAIENNFYMVDPLTGNHITPPSSINAFGYGGIFGTFHKYTYNFTAPTNSMVYPFQMLLRDNVGTVVSISDYINVNNVKYPMLQTYKFNPNTGFLEECGTFNHTDTLYLKIVTRDTDSSIINVLTGDIQVADYTGRYVIKKLPPAATVYSAAPAYSAPLSSLFKTSAGAGLPGRIADTDSTGVYTFEIVLRDAYQGWWLPRTNAYTLTLSEIADNGYPGTAEDYNSLSVQFNVTAPLSTTDIVAAIGSGSYTWSSSGASWSENSLVWFKGGERSDQWTKTVIDANTKNGPVGLALTDVDGDSYKDLIVGWQDQSVSVGWYRNMKIDGSQWSTVPYIIAPAFDALPGTNNYGGGADRGNSNEDITVYATRNGGFQSNYYSVNEIAGALSTGDFDGYGDQEVVVSYVHPVVYTTATSTGGADYSNSYGMFFNRGIYVYWNIIQGGGSVTKTPLDGTLSYLSGSGDYGANGNNNPGAMSTQCVDLNKDGYDDIVAVYQDGTTLVWLNQYGKLTGNSTYRQENAFGLGSLISNLPKVPGKSPWDDPAGQNGRFAQLRLMDMNKDGYPDIIRTSTVGQGAGSADANIYVIYTKQSTTNNPQTPNFESHSYGTATGSIANLLTFDTNYENITESVVTSSDTGIPGAKAGNDTTGATLSWLNTQDANPTNPSPTSPYFNSGVYGVAKGNTIMSINGFTLNAANSGKTIASASLNMKYIVWPPPTNNPQTPIFENHTYGTATGTYTTNLADVDNLFENITEQTVTTADTGTPAAKAANDTSTPATLGTTLNSQDASGTPPSSGVQAVARASKILSINGFTLNAANSGKIVASASLNLRYYVGSASFAGTKSVLVSFDGTTWKDTGIKPSSADALVWRTPTINLVALKGSTVTYTDLANLKVVYINNDASGSGTKTVYFDVLNEAVTFYEAMQADWTWRINSDSTYPFHDLTVNGYCSDNSETFSVRYSIDGSNWNTLGSISLTTGQDYTWSLPANAGSYYYIRIVDSNKTPSDQTPSSLCVNMIKLSHNNGPSGYAGTNNVKISFDGVNWFNTNVKPSASDTTWKTVTVDLVAIKGSPVTYNDLKNLRVVFVNNDISGGASVRTVWFDVLNEQVTYYEAMQADWSWNINNDATYPFHNLTISAFCLDNSESFSVMYSVDNSNWVSLGSISDTTPKNYSWSLPMQAGSLYYIRIVDNNKAISDQTPSTLCINMIKILHYPADVSWSDKTVITISNIGASEFITAIAVGDIGKSWDDFKADTYPDIVVSTSKVGNGDTTHTLFVIFQGAGGSAFEQPTAVDTSLLASRVGNNNAIYDTKAIELGDFNGDKNLDVVLVLGFAPGRTGSGVPSLFIYSNRPDLGPAEFQEATVNALDISQSVINVQTGNIDLTILLPFLGMFGVIAGEAFVERRKRKK